MVSDELLKDRAGLLRTLLQQLRHDGRVQTHLNGRVQVPGERLTECDRPLVEGLQGAFGLHGLRLGQAGLRVRHTLPGGPQRRLRRPLLRLSVTQTFPCVSQGPNSVSFLLDLSLIHTSEPTRLGMISYA